MNLATAAQRIHDATVEFLAVKHKSTIPQMEAWLRIPRTNLKAQYVQLVTLAVDKAAEMVRNGEIEVTK